MREVRSVRKLAISGATLLLLQCVSTLLMNISKCINAQTDNLLIAVLGPKAVCILSKVDGTCTRCETLLHCALVLTCLPPSYIGQSIEVSFQIECVSLCSGFDVGVYPWHRYTTKVSIGRILCHDGTLHFNSERHHAPGHGRTHQRAKICKHSPALCCAF